MERGIAIRLSRQHTCDRDHAIVKYHLLIFREEEEGNITGEEASKPNIHLFSGKSRKVMKVFGALKVMKSKARISLYQEKIIS